MFFKQNRYNLAFYEKIDLVRIPCSINKKVLKEKIFRTVNSRKDICYSFHSA